MTSRRKIQFKVDNIVMVEELRDLTIDEIERVKALVAQECDCAIEDVDVDTIEAEVEMSEDVDWSDDTKALVFWRALYPDPIVGVMCEVDENSDAFIELMKDFMLNRNTDKVLQSLDFFVEKVA